MRKLCLLLLLVFSTEAPLSAKVADQTLDWLIENSDFIGIVKTTEIKTIPDRFFVEFQGFVNEEEARKIETKFKIKPEHQLQGFMAQPVKIAKATVIQSWKGEHLKEVEFRAFGTWMCDVSQSRAGEEIIVFLRNKVEDKVKSLKVFDITLSGNGRMPLRNLYRTSYAEYSNIIMPKSISTRETTSYKELADLNELRNYLTSHPKLIEQAWKELMEKDGCLIGNTSSTLSPSELEKRVSKSFEETGGGFGILCARSWSKFLNESKEAKVKFLVSRLPLKSKTNIHTCPHDVATEGELAVYALQCLTHREWFQYKGKNPLISQAINERLKPDTRTSDQSHLWKILGNKEARTELSRFFEEKL